MAERLARAHVAEVDRLSRAITAAIYAEIAATANPAAIDAWFASALERILAQVHAGYIVNSQSTTEYLLRHAGLARVPVQVVPGTLDVQRLTARLRIVGPVQFKANSAKVAAAGARWDAAEQVRTMATRMSGVADELVRNGDRDVIVATAQRGQGLVGWRRRLGGRGCGFCAMLVSRGAVYVSRQRGLLTGFAGSPSRSSGEPFHPHCRCYVEPLYSHESEPRDVRALQDRWGHVTAGRSGADAVRTWNRWWDAHHPG